MATKKQKFSAKQVLDELKTPGLVLVGMIGGNLLGKVIDKAVPIDETQTGFQAKALIKPVVLITAGVGGTILLKDKNLKLIAGGVAASGVASTVKVFLKKDLLAGLAEFAGLGNTGALKEKVFRDPIQLKVQPYTPDLVELPPASKTIDVEEAPMSGMDDYQEVQEVEIL